MVPRSFFDLGPEMANERLHTLAHGVVPLNHLREDLSFGPEPDIVRTLE